MNTLLKFMHMYFLDTLARVLDVFFEFVERDPFLLYLVSLET